MPLTQAFRNEFLEIPTIYGSSRKPIYSTAVDIVQLVTSRVRDAKKEWLPAGSIFIQGSYGSAAECIMETALEIQILRIKAERWKRLVMDPNASGDVDALTETADVVFDVIGEFGPRSISLVGLDASQVNGEHLATLLRASFSWRGDIPGWAEALEVAKISLKRAGYEPSEALFGMI